MLDLLTRSSDSSFNPYQPEGTILYFSDTHNMWRVRYKSTDWFAVTNEPTPLQAGDKFRVLGYLSSTTLLIEPI